MRLTEALNVKHVICEGSRRHVHSYTLCECADRSAAPTWCSEPFCEDNIAAVRAVKKIGIDPAAVCPSPKLADWLRSPAARSALDAEGER